MKKISMFVLPLMVGALLFQGCKKDLTVVPGDKISSETFWESPNDARLALNGCYSIFASAWTNVYEDAKTDNAYAQHPWESNATAIAAGNINATLDAGYNGGYQTVRKTNYFLDNIDKVEMDSALQQRFIAEAKTIRAFAYFNLAWTFGPVPLIKHYSVEESDYKIAPTPEDEVIQFCLTELSDAAKDLPNSYQGGENYETGRVTKGAALSIKARIELYYEMWADAAKDAQTVMGLGYELFQINSLSKEDSVENFSKFVDFENNAAKVKFYKGVASYMQQFWKANDGNSGVILASQNLQDSDFPNSLRTYFAPANLSGWSSITPTQALVNAYWNLDGTKFNPSSREQRATNYNKGNPNNAFFNEYENRGTRFYASILFQGASWNRFQNGYVFHWTGNGSNNSKTSYNFTKLVDPKYTDQSMNAPNDFPIIRYAEILLTYAEAKNEASGPTTAVYDALDLIRERAGMPDVDRAEYNSKTKLRKLIHHERRIELAGEGQRAADIRRWEIGDEVMHNVYDLNNDVVQQRKWQDKFVKMPYPQAALDHNPNLEAAQDEKGY
ncbi:MAG TPA: RagB/SusD family nutrient uptake outer membrane protein [Chitinophagaceae bacterium]|nr:RagB/SusD family nutrient uptake outer membrane protein [Chitinophagaceae bacterium]